MAPTEVQNVPLLAALDAARVACLLENARELILAPGEILFAEGASAENFYILLEGRLRISKRVGEQEIVLVTHEAGAFTGEIPLLAGTPFVATAHAVGRCRILCVEQEDFFAVLISCPPAARMILRATAQRVELTQALAQQHEKLISLGTMAAGLAHELNNPAAAARRAGCQLRGVLRRNEELSLRLGALGIDPDGLAMIRAIGGGASVPAVPRDSLARSDREEELNDWMLDRGIDEPWALSSTLVEMGLDVAGVCELAGRVDAVALEPALRWLESSRSARDLVEVVEQGATRISELVQAVKSYSYMDQGRVQEVDVRDGIESTLTILRHRLRNVEVLRDFAPELPRLQAHGSELNQVWTNLIDNAVHAMGEKGTLRIRTRRDDGHVLVEIADSGPGMAPAVQRRIFEPFFTTKEVGEGTGIGLSTVYRIVRQEHGGEITVQSSPGETVFAVRLPIQQGAGIQEPVRTATPADGGAREVHTPAGTFSG